MLTPRERQIELEELTRPLIKWLNENFHPHVTITIGCTTATLHETLNHVVVTDYIKD